MSAESSPALDRALLEALKQESLDMMLKALERYFEWFGAEHDDDCPKDDTCSCSWKPVNDGVNAAFHFIKAIRAHAAAPQAPRQTEQTKKDKEKDLSRVDGHS